MPIYEKTGGVAPVYDTVVCGGGPSGWIAAYYKKKKYVQ